MMPRTPLLAAMLLGAALGTRSTLVAQDRKPGATFRDCPGCPEMVVVPTGKFLMGSPASEAGRDVDGAEDPQHQVTIAYPLAVGKYEVTRDEYARFVKEAGLADPRRLQHPPGDHAALADDQGSELAQYRIPSDRPRSGRLRELE